MGVLLGGAIMKQGIVAPTVSFNAAFVSKLRFNNTCHAGVKYYAIGVEGAGGPAAVFDTARGDWLDTGSGSQVWIERTINSGVLDWFDPGSGRLRLDVDRSYGILRPSVGIDTANVTFDAYDAASGGNLLDSVTLTFTAEFTV
jgi:hypothetical protein